MIAEVRSIIWGQRKGLECHPEELGFYAGSQGLLARELNDVLNKPLWLKCGHYGGESLGLRRRAMIRKLLGGLS